MKTTEPIKEVSKQTILRFLFTLMLGTTSLYNSIEYRGHITIPVTIQLNNGFIDIVIICKGLVDTGVNTDNSKTNGNIENNTR